MSTATSETVITNGNGNGNSLPAMFNRYGLPGLVIAVLLYFAWWNMQKVSGVVEKNTETMAEFKGTVSQMSEALKDNTNAINQLRIERRTRVER
jgi:hypothetical protein